MSTTTALTPSSLVVSLAPDIKSEDLTSSPHLLAEPLLLFEQVSKWHGSVLALNHVTLELRGGVTGLVGSNGAGKSTLLKLATGQLRPTLGRVTVRGLDAWDWRTRRYVGYCPDIDTFYEDLTGWGFVHLMARMAGYCRKEAQRRTADALQRVSMATHGQRRIRAYSKGMRQRIKIAAALLHDPELLILDEPLAGIDPVGRQDLLDLFRNLAGQGKGLFISSHELEALEKLTNHVVILARGRVAAVGTITQIRDMLDNHPLSVRIDYDQPRTLARLLLALPEVLAVEVYDQAILVRTTHPRCFFREFGQLVVREKLNVRQLLPVDDDAHAVLGYLLGGSGRT